MYDLYDINNFIFLAVLQSSFGLWIDDVHLSTFWLTFKWETSVCVKVLDLALQTVHNIFSGFLI